MAVRMALVFVVVVASACASSRAGRSGPGGDVIGVEELGTVHVTNAYEIIERLRPTFLRGRGQTSIMLKDSQYPVVYVDGMKHGGLEVLRRVPAQDVREIRYISASDATTRYGTGHAAGVIEIHTRRS